MKDYAALKRRIADEGIQYVDFRIADLVGRFRHVTIPAERFTEDLLVDGIGFDGSNFGYRGVVGSDMILLPDLSTAYVEERCQERILTLIADICEASTRQAAEIDPRRIVKAAVERARVLGIADDVFVSPEFEFYLFDRVHFGSGCGENLVDIIPAEACEHASLARVGRTERSAYHAPLPQDIQFGLRCEMARQIQAAGIPVKYHHHEVGSFGQHEIELGFDGLVRMADAVFIVKSIVRNVAVEAGQTATFLPKPIHGEAGNGMHLHQYLVKDGTNLFLGENGLSDLALCYVGGLLTHGRSLMALTNPTTNSYRRLVPGYEAPIHLVFGSANRSAAVRVPTYARADKTRIELRTMDATCNPYLAFAAILLAGLDGIERELNAQSLGMGPFDHDLYERRIGEPAPRSLDEALRALEDDHGFLTAGGIFSEEGLAHWMDVKRRESRDVDVRPHPHEFALYYDL